MSSKPDTIIDETLPVAERPRRRWLTILLGLLIFGAGFASGVGVTIVVAVHRLQYAIHHPEEAPARVAATLKRKFRLDDAQASKIETTVAKHQVELAAIRNEFQPRVMVQLQEIRDEIGEVLDTSQRERWNKMFDDVRDRWLPPVPPAVVTPKS